VSVPTQGSRTWYSQIGDTFAYASGVGLLVLMGAALRPGRRRTDTTGTPARPGSGQAERPAPLDSVVAG